MTVCQPGARVAWLCAGLTVSFAPASIPSALADEAPTEARSSTIFKLIGAGLALRYEATACKAVLTPKQRDAVAGKLDALIKEAESTPAEVAAFKARIKTKIDPLIEANPNFCTTITHSLASYVNSFVIERPTAEWEDAAQSASKGSTAVLGNWTVDTQDCTITSAYQDADDSNRLTGIFVGKVQGAIAVTLQNEAWTWDKGEAVAADTLIDDTSVPPSVGWHSTKTGQFLSAVFPAKTLPAFSKATEIKLTIPGKDATTFHIAGIADALTALESCGK